MTSTGIRMNMGKARTVAITRIIMAPLQRRDPVR